MGFGLSGKKTIEKYLLLRDMKIPYNEAKEIANCCHGFLSWIDPKSNFAKEAIRITKESNLRGREALEKIDNYVKEELSNYSGIIFNKENFTHQKI